MKSPGTERGIDQGAEVQEAGEIFSRESLGVWAESGPGTASHLK